MAATVEAFLAQHEQHIGELSFVRIGGRHEIRVLCHTCDEAYAMTSADVESAIDAALREHEGVEV